MSAIAWATVEDAIQAWIVAGSGLASDHVTWAEQTAPRPTGEFISLRMTVLQHRGRDWLDRADNVVPIGPLAISGRSGNSLTVTGHGLVTGQGPLTPTTTGTLPGGLTGANVWPVVVDANTLQFAATFANAVAASPTVITITSAGTGANTLSGSTLVPGAEVLQRLRGPRRAILTLQCFAGAPTGGAATGTTSPYAVLHDAISSYALESRATALAAAGVGVGQIEPIQSIDGIVNTTRFEPRAIGIVFLHLASEIVETSTYIQVVNATDSIPGPSITVTLP